MAARRNEYYNFRRNVCILIALLYSTVTFSQNRTTVQESSIFAKGKIWKCVRRFYVSDRVEGSINSRIYEVLGDTIVNGDKWWRIAYRYEMSEIGKGSTFYVIEKDGIAYRADSPDDMSIAHDPYSDGISVRLDYNVGDTEEDGSTAEIDSVFVGGKLRKRMIFRNFSTEGDYRIIEGIGCNSDIGFYGPHNMSYYTELLEVYDNGELIATKEDFFKDGTTGISTAGNSGDAGTLLYDLTGRRLSGKPAKGICIENRRKVCR